ncbi:MAG: hypothetical protein ABL308_13610 [Oceanicaulis sp.]
MPPSRLARPAFVPLACAAVLTAACTDANGGTRPAQEDARATRSEATASDTQGGCTASVSRAIEFSGAETPDTIRASVDYETCPEAAVTVTVRDPRGGLLFTDAFKLEALKLAQDWDGAQPLLDQFIENVSLRDADALEPFAEATAGAPENPIPIRPVATEAIYERARSAGGTVLCFPVHYETRSCIWHDRERGGTFHLYYSGP